MTASARSLSFHPEARAELIAATEWYLERSLNAAQEFGSAIEHALEHITQTPERYPETRFQCRRFVLLKFPYNIIYRISTDQIEIVAVAHQSRRPSYWRNR